MELKFLRTLVATISLLMPFTAHATNDIACSGTVEVLGLHSANGVYVKLSGMNALVMACDLGATVGPINPVPAEQCKAIYGMLLSAHATGKSLNIMFDNVLRGTSCTTFTAWETASARWVTFQ